MSSQAKTTAINPVKAVFCCLLALILSLGLVPVIPQAAHATEAAPGGVEPEVPQAEVVSNPEGSSANLAGRAPSDFLYDNLPLLEQYPQQAATYAADPTEPVYGSHEWAEAKYPGHTHTTSFTPGQKLAADATYVINSPIVVNKPSGGESGLEVPATSTVTLVIETGGSLTVSGGDGSGMSMGGGAGIRVPQGARFVVDGAGSLSATGGKGGTPTEGQLGGTPSYNSGSRKIISGNGGNGGDGAAAPGAGVGGKGSGGTAGGLGGRAVENTVRATGGSLKTLGFRGGDSATSAVGEACGTVILQGRIQLNAQAGSVDASWTNGALNDWTNIRVIAGSTMDRATGVALHGAGGGGGGRGAGSAAVGGGASGGTGGGGGGSGCIDGGRDTGGNGFFNIYYYGHAGGGGGGSLYGYAGGIKGGPQAVGEERTGTPGTDRSKPFPNQGGWASFTNRPADDAQSGAGEGGDAQPRGMGGAGGNLFYADTMPSLPSTRQIMGDGAVANSYQVFPASDCEIVFKDPTASDGVSWAYTGSNIEPLFDVVYKPTGVVVPTTAYTPTWAANKDGGTATLTVTGPTTLTPGKPALGNGAQTGGGRIPKTFDIKYDVDDAQVFYTNFLKDTTNWFGHTEAAITPVSLKTKPNDAAGTPGVALPASAYTTNYANNVDPGMNTAKFSFTLTPNVWLNASKIDTLAGAFSIITKPIITAPDTLYGLSVGQPFNFGLSATMEPTNSGDTITWLAQSSLPPGLALASDGTISGTPTLKAKYVVTVAATNKAGTTLKQITFDAGDLAGKAFYEQDGVVRPVKDVEVQVYKAGHSGDAAALLGTTTTNVDGGYSFTGIANNAMVDVVFKTPDATKYRVKGGVGEVAGVALSSATCATVNMEFERSVAVTLDASPYGSFASNPKIATGFPGDSMILPNPETITDGKRCIGWFESAESTAAPAPAVFPSADTTYVAHYDEVLYEVTYITSDDADQIAPRQVKFGAPDLMVDPAPKRPGYVFKHWYYSTSDVPSVDIVVKATTTYKELVNSDKDIKSINLKAAWDTTKIDMTLQANGSTDFPATIDGATSKLFSDLTYQTLIDYPAPVRDGFSFVGWSQLPNYTEGTDDAQYKPIMSIAAPGFDTTYFAQWQAKEVGVEFDMMGGQSSSGNGTYSGKPGTTGNIPAKPERTGYSFKGWYTTPTGNTQAYTPDDTSFTYPTGTTYYYAQWQAAEVDLTLTAANGAPDSQTIHGTYGTTVSYSLPQRSGYAFLGWKLPDGSTSMFVSFPDKNATYEAVWAAGQTAVAFNAMGGVFKAGESGIRQGSAGDPYTLPIKPDRTGYEFKGWYTTPECVTAMPTTLTYPAQSVTYYAKWVPMKVNVVLNAPDSDILTQAGKNDPGDFGTIIEYDIPQKTNAAFVGWKVAGADNSTATMFPTYPATDNTVYEAVFEDGVVSVFYNTMGGRFVQSDDGRRTGKVGDTYSAISEVELKGNNFVGWFDDPVAGNKYTGNTFLNQANTVYYAHWTPKPITLVFEAGEGAEPRTQTKNGAYGTAVGGLDTPVREGHTFMGWKFAGEIDSAALKAPKFLDTAPSMEAVWAPNSIVATYDLQGGTLIAGKLTNAGIPDAEYTVPSVARAGYEFDGWFTLPLGGSEVQKSGTAKLPGKSVTYYAHFHEKQIIATLDAGADAAPPTQNVSGNFGSVMKYDLPSKPNNAFTGWRKATTSGTPEMFPVFGADTGVVYDAVWAPGQANVTYDPDGGTFPAGVSGSFTGPTGTDYNNAPASPGRTGYEFGGWYTERAGAGSPYTSTIYPSASNTVVYAKWTPLRVEVTFDANYVGAPAPEKVSNLTYGQAVNYTQPTRQGYGFSGWSTTPDGGAVGATMSPVAPADNTTLYAQWTAGSVSVRFDALGGAFVGSDDGVRSGFAGKTPLDVPASPEKSGFDFAGWFSDSACTAAADTSAFPLADATYFAKWNAKNVTVRLEGASGSFTGGAEYIDVPGTFGAVVAFETPVRAGYTFKGWKLKSADASTAQMTLLFPAQATTYEAVWDANEIVVTYDYTGGKFDNKTSISFKGEPAATYSAPDPAQIKRDGYTCTGFYTAPTGGSLVNSSTLPTANATYFAQWSERSDVKATFSLAGGTVGGDGTPITKTGTYNTAIVAPEPVMPGFAFIGWKTASADASTATKYLVFPANDTTYTAVWGPAGQSSVTYNAMGGKVSGNAAWTHTGEVNSDYNSPAVEGRAGWTFLGWSTSVDPAVSIDHAQNVARKVPATPMSYFAQWQQDAYEVTLDFGVGSPSTQTVQGHLGEVISYSIPDRAGFAFKGFKPASSPTDTPTLTPKFTQANNTKTLVAVWEAVNITVVFNATGGAGSASFSGTTEDTYTVPANPTRTGWNFVGWNSSLDGSGTPFNETVGSTVSFDASQPVAWYAQWTQESYTVTLDAGLGSFVGGTTKNYTGHFGDVIAYNEPQRPGYTFVGFVVAGQTRKHLTFPDADATYSAQWAQGVATITLDLNGEGARFVGEKTGGIPEDGLREGLTDETILPALPPTDPQRTGYAFTGWYTDKACTSKVTSFVSSYPAGGLTYFAGWQIKHPTVKLSAPEATNGLTLQESAGDWATPIAYQLPQRDGYTFQGWQKKDPMSGNLGSAQMQPTFPEENTTFVASWKEGTVVVRFDAAGGTFVAPEDGVRPGNPGTSFELPALDSVKKPGYSFLGWFSSPVGGTQITGTQTMPVRGAQYYAHWEAAEIALTLNMNDAGTSSATQSKTGAFNSTLVYDMPVRTNYTFVGWSKTSDNNPDTLTMFPVLDLSLQGSVLYAQWSADAVQVSFFAWPGASDSSQLLRVGESYTVLQNPTREGYVFEGWYSSTTGGTALGKPAGGSAQALSAGNITWYARWTFAQTEVVLDAGAGAMFDDGSQTKTLGPSGFGQPIDYGSAPIKSGYTFKGWKLRATPERPNAEASLSLTYPASNSTYDAVWAKDDVVLTLNANDGNFGVGGSGTETINGPATDRFSMPATKAVREGYTLKGWYSLPKGGTLVIAADATTANLPLASATYFAQWEANNVTVTLLASGAQSNEEQIFTGKYGEVIEYSIPTKNGGGFIGWIAQGQTTSVAFPTFPSTNETFTAEFASGVRTALFRAMGGEFEEKSAGVPDDGVRQGLTNSTLTPPVLKARGGYTFEGWWTLPNGEGVALPNSANIPTSDTIYYAHWLAQNTTITLDANGGSIPNTVGVADTERDETGKVGTLVNYQDKGLPTRAGFGFMGWATSANAPAGDLFPVYPNVVTPGTNDKLYAVWEAGSISVAFRAQGGQATSDSTAFVVSGAPEDPYTAPKAERIGYDFVGWYPDPVNQTVSGPAAGVATKLPTANTTYYAHWQARPITVTLDGQNNTNPQEVQGSQGDIIEYRDPVLEGYSFKGWSKTPVTTFSGQASGATKHPVIDASAADQNNRYSLYAVWAPNNVMVSYDATLGTPGWSNGSIAAGSSYNIPADPVRAGYEFAGWYSAPVGGVEHTADPAAAAGKDIAPTKDAIYFAHWTPLQVALNLNAAGGSFSGGAGAYTTPLGTVGQPLTYEVPTRKGYVFKGWNATTTPDQSTATFSLVYPAITPSAAGEPVTTYYALWQPVANVKSVYYLQGGSFDEEDPAKQQPADGLPGTTYTAPGAKREGYTFLGWTASADAGASVVHTKGTSVERAQDSLVSFYAKWEAVPIKAKLLLNDSTGNVHEMPSGIFGQAIAYTMPTRAGYTFIGWSQNAVDSTGSMVPAYTLPASGDTISYYAIWAKGKATVSFFGQGGQDVSTTVNVGETVYVPANPTRPGYSFDAWYSDAACTNLANITEGQPLIAGPAANTAYWAGWRATQSTLTLMLNDNTSDEHEKLTGNFGEAAGYTTPTRPGYTFVGWSENPAATSGDSSLAYSDTNKTYHAIWSADNIVLSLEAQGGTIVGDTQFLGTAGDSYTAPASPVRDGYTFKGWSLKPVCADPADIVALPAVLPATTTMYFAQWQRDTSVLTLKLNGGNVNGSVLDQSVHGAVGERVVYKTPTRLKYLFKGWKLTGTDDKTADMYLAYPAAPAATYEAVWEKVGVLKVEYFALDGTVVGLSAFTNELTDRYVAPDFTPNEGLVFMGWSATPDSSVVNHAKGDSLGFGPDAQTFFYPVLKMQETISVTFNLDGGTIAGSTDSVVKHDLRVGDALGCTAPEKKGMIFVGWAPEATPSAKPSQDLVVPTKNTTYKAVWEQDGYANVRSVVFNGNGGQVVGSSSCVGRMGESYVTASVAPRAGYVFDGWSATPDGAVLYAASVSVPFDLEVQRTLYAHWTLRQDIAVALDPNGGTMGSSGSVVEVSALKPGSAIGYVTPVREGFVFLGWSLNKTDPVGEVTLSTPFLNQGDPKPTYFAIWLEEGKAPGMVALYYDAMGGATQGDAFMTGIANTGYTAPSVGTRAGYVFKGWAESPTGSVVQNAAGSYLYPDTSKTFYAIWEQTPVSVSFDANGGTLGDVPTMSGLPGAYLSPAAPARAGYLFVGWSKDGSATEGAYQVVIENSPATYFALWMEMPTAADVRVVAYDAQGGQCVPRAVYQGVAGGTFSAPDASGRAGYTFKGWAKTPEGALDHVAGASLSFGSDTVEIFYAVWQRIVGVTVTLDAGEGSLAGQSVYTDCVANSVLVPPLPTREGYVFIGWSQTESDTPSSAIVVPDTNATYHARYQKIPDPAESRVATYFGMGGTVDNQSVFVGVKDGSYLAPSATRAGWVFEGWSATEDATSVAHAAGATCTFGADTRVSYYAKWSRMRASVALDGDGGTPQEQLLCGGVGDLMVYATPEKPGYLFSGWSTVKGSPSGTMEPKYAAELNGAELYATWTRKGQPVPDPAPDPSPNPGPPPLPGAGGSSQNPLVGPSPLYIYVPAGPSLLNYVGNNTNGAAAQLAASSATATAKTEELNKGDAVTTSNISVSLSVSAGGAVITEIKNGHLSYTFVPDEGYELDQVNIDGRSLELQNNTYTFEEGGDHTVAICFVKNVETQIATVAQNIIVGVLTLVIWPAIVAAIAVSVYRRKMKAKSTQQ